MLAGDRAAAVFAHGAAEAHYRLALELAERGGDGARRAEAWEKLAGVLRSMGQLAEALDGLEHAAMLYQTLGDLEGEGRVAAQIAEVQVERGALEEGRARALSVLPRLENQSPSPALAALHLALAPNRDTGRDPREALSHVERASELARALGDDGTLARAGVRRGMFLMALGYPEEARCVLEEVMPQIESAADYRTRILGLGILAELQKLAGEFASCRATLTRLVQLAEQADDAAWLVSALAPLGEIHFLLGDWQQARLHLNRALTLSHGLVDRHLAAFALLGLAQLEMAVGHRRDALRHIERCLADTQHSADRHMARHARRLLAHYHLLESHPNEALHELVQLCREESESHPATLAALARAYLATEQTDLADHAARKATESATTRNNRLDLCEALLVQAEIFARLGRPEDAESILDHALKLTEATSYPYARARVLYQRGLIAARKTNAERSDGQDQANASLHEALAIFRRLGAAPDIGQTECVLAEIPTE